MQKSAGISFCASATLVKNNIATNSFSNNLPELIPLFI
jgi:hypothetical protein